MNHQTQSLLSERERERERVLGRSIPLPQRVVELRDAFRELTRSSRERRVEKKEGEGNAGSVWPVSGREGKRVLQLES